MEYFIDLIARYIVLIALIEVLFAAFIIWVFMHEDRFTAFEDWLLYILRKSLINSRKRVFLFVRKAFIFIYRPYRQMKINICKKILAEYGMKAVRERDSAVQGLEYRAADSEEVRNEVLPG